MRVRRSLGAAIALALLASVSLGSGASAIAAPTTDLVSAFTDLRASAVWPVQGGVADAMTSTFGPRIKVSTGLYDWHRGIDLDAPEGTPVLATLDGTFFDITTYADGGLTVILKHTFPTPVLFQGKTLSSFYTFHMHLSAVAPELEAAQAAGLRPSVAKGSVIGAVGHSGTAVDDHLHFEVRVGTPYSLEWQLAHPTSVYGANTWGFDPHVHPMLLATPAATHGMALTLTQAPGKRDGIVRFSADDDQPLLDRVLVTIVRKSDGRVMATHTLALDERIGFDATTNAALDTPTTTKPYFSPQPFGTRSPYVTDVVIPKAFVGTAYGTKYRTTITATDIWGRAVQLAW